MKILLRPGIAIRGRSDIESNIYQFNLDKAKNDHSLKLLMKEERYTTSHDILDEQRNMLVSAARRELLAGSLEKKFYSILADESSDIAKKEQLSFSVRTCSNDYEVFEDFLGVFECMDGVSTDSLLHYIKDIHQRTLLDGQKMVAMGFDGAAAMKSLAQKLKSEIAPNVIYVHCFAHCNELIVKDAIKESGLLETSLDLCQSMYTIVGAYPTHILLFENIQKDYGYEQETKHFKVLRLQNLPVTRWTTRVQAANIVFEILCKTLEKMKDDSSNPKDTADKIKRLLKNHLSSLEVLFNLNATRKLLIVSEKLSKEFQAVGISADYALYSVKHVIQRFTEMRCAEEFESILKEAKNVCGLTGDTDGLRHSKIPKRPDDSVIFCRLLAREEVNISKVRQSYYEAINAHILSLHERFNQKEF